MGNTPPGPAPQATRSSAEPDRGRGPTAPREPHQRNLHGVRTTDPWFWMRDTHDPRVAKLIAAENAHTATVTAPTAPRTGALFDEIRGRIRETDRSVPLRRGDWWYLTRTVQGRAYPVHLRAPVSEHPEPPDDDAGFTVILDENDVADGHPYSQIGAAVVSPDGTRLAWSVDHTGDEAHTLHVRDLATGADGDDTVTGVSYPLAWSADSRFVFYTTLDDIQRPWQVWRHRIGTDAARDVLVFEEPDERYYLSVEANRSDDWILITAASAITNETWLLDAHDPTGDPRCVAPRVTGVEHLVEAHRDRLFVLTNADGAEDFALFAADPHDPDRPWTPVLAHQPGTRLEAVDAFQTHLVVASRSGGTTELRILDLDGTEADTIVPDEPVGTLTPGTNPEFATTTYRYEYESLVTPPTVIDADLHRGTRTIRRRQPVLGGYDPAAYRTERIGVHTDDGTTVPVSLVRHRDTPFDGTAPAVLYGYGAYEISMDPWFSAARLSLLDRGWVFAIAHVRGGGELGRRWYTHGKFAAKPNSFTDFVACAGHLAAIGVTAPDRLVARGGSAGGLLVGAAMNLAPERFAAVVAEVPFVDPLNTLVDPTLPLTVTEWEEWGDPLHDAEAAATIAAYSPYENVRAVPYPAVLVTAGVHDPRVSVHEPLKWVQRLRATTTGDRPILARIDTGGHGGPTGRYDAWAEEAFILSFMLDQVATGPPPDAPSQKPFSSL